MNRVYVELVGGKIAGAYTNCGEVEVLIIDKDNHEGHRVVAKHTPDLIEKDERSDRKVVGRR